MKLPSVLVLAPCYVSSFGPARDSVANFMAQYSESGGHTRIKSVWRDSCLSEARSLCVEHHAIPGDFHTVLWVDDDNCFSPTDAMRIVEESIHLKAIVGALYRTRSEQGKLICGFTPNGEAVQPDSGIREVTWIGFGLTAMPMPLVRTLWEAHKYDLFRDTRSTKDAKHALEISEMRGDDAAFCRHAREMGQNVFVDTDVKIGHIGPTIFKVGQ